MPPRLGSCLFSIISSPYILLSHYSPLPFHPPIPGPWYALNRAQSSTPERRSSVAVRRGDPTPPSLQATHTI